jgi:hypothetical protein
MQYHAFSGGTRVTIRAIDGKDDKNRYRALPRLYVSGWQASAALWLANSGVQSGQAASHDVHNDSQMFKAVIIVFQALRPPRAGWVFSVSNHRNGPRDRLL